MLQLATGRTPIVIGKPEPIALDLIKKRSVLSLLFFSFFSVIQLQICTAYAAITLTHRGHLWSAIVLTPTSLLGSEEVSRHCSSLRAWPVLRTLPFQRRRPTVRKSSPKPPRASLIRRVVTITTAASSLTITWLHLATSTVFLKIQRSDE